jgi:hypothetical protein
MSEAQADRRALLYQLVGAIGEIDPEIPWVIWSEKHGAWWKGDELGYTNSLAAAGRYTRERAQAILARSNHGPCVHCIAFPSPVLFFGRTTVAGLSGKEMAGGL